MTMTDWISVKDRLPEVWKDVLLCAGGEVCEGHLFKDGWFEDSRENHMSGVTHWMPLPEPPKAEELPHNRYYSGDGVASDRTEGPEPGGEGKG